MISVKDTTIRGIRTSSHMMKIFKRSSIPQLFSCLLLSSTLLAQTSQPEQNKSTPDRSTTDADILRHLSTAITWYREIRDKVQTTGLPTDTIYLGNLQALATQSLQLAFQSALAEAALEQAVEKSSPQAQSAVPENVRNMEAFSDKLTASNAALQDQLAQLQQKMTGASGAKLVALKQQQDRLQGELNMGTTMRSTVNQILSFVDQNEQVDNGSLAAGISKLQKSVPELTSAASDKSTPPATNTAALQQPGGLIGQSELLYDQGLAIHNLDRLVDDTTKVEEAARTLRTPLLAQLKAAINQGKALAEAADGNVPGQPAPTGAEFNSLSLQFNQVSAADVPLSKELILLDQSKANIHEWRDSLAQSYGRSLRSVLTRVGGIVLMVAILLTLSEIWKRVTFRYVKDLRRRRQFLLIRRIVMTFMMGLVIALGFVSEISSLATFAGFITAGLAVGLQTILLSVAAYFFLVGRYGIRVGDRITISGVTGDVADVGLVRFYLMELAGTGIEMYPTGRLVVFSNAILFTATTPLFKQVPGTEMAWHEVSLHVNPQADLARVEAKLLEVVTDVFQQYRGDLERQHGAVERRIEIRMQAPVPSSLIQFTDTGLEVVVRYPVALEHLASVDDQISRALAAIVDQDADIKSAVVGLPKLRAAVKQ